VRQPTPRPGEQATLGGDRDLGLRIGEDAGERHDARIGDARLEGERALAMAGTSDRP